MSQVITGLSFDLKMLVGPGFPPPCTVAFTDVATDGHESTGRVTFVDVDAQTLWDAPDKITAAKTLLTARAAALPDLPTIAAKMTANDDLDRQLRAKRAQLETADAMLAMKQVELTALDAPAGKTL